MSMIIGKALIAGGGGNNNLNIFCSNTQPDKQNGLWIKRAKEEVSKVLIKSDYYLADGEGANLPGDATSVLGSIGYTHTAAVKIGNKIYMLPLAVMNTTGFIYDIDTGIFTKQPGPVNFTIMTSSIAWCAHDDKIYTLSHNSVNHYIDVYAYNPVSNSVSSVASILTSPYQEETYGMWVSDEYIFLAGGTVYSSHWYDRPILYDRSTRVATVITNTQKPGYARGAGYVFKNDAKLYFVGYCMLAYSYDLQTGQFEYIDKHLLPLNNLSYIHYSPNTFFYALGKLYLIGFQDDTSTITTYGKKRDVIVYDLVSEQTTSLKNVINEDAARSLQYFGGIDFQGTLQAGFFGGYLKDTSSSSEVYSHKIMVFNIQTNEFSNGTVVCQPSTKENVTEMYSDKLSTLDFGVSEVYYQSADGFSKQPAVIIKNGVATDIGGVTPEPTPTLEGTWVLNDTLSAPENWSSEDVEFNAINTAGTNYSVIRVFLSEGSSSGKTLNLSSGQSSKIIYWYQTNAWATGQTNNKYNTWTFPSGATASDAFRAWLTSNATKQ